MLGLAVVGITSTFTLAAAGRFAKPAGDDEGTAVAPPPPATTPAPASRSATAEAAAFVVSSVGSRAPSHKPKALDALDPWASSPKTFRTAGSKAKPQPLDTTDPWSGEEARGGQRALSAARLDVSDPWAATP